MRMFLENVLSEYLWVLCENSWPACHYYVFVAGSGATIRCFGGAAKCSNYP